MPNETPELTACTDAPVYLPMDMFRPSDSNPRRINDEDFDRLRRDVADERMQRARPIIIDLHERDIVGGNMRYRAKAANGDTHGWFWIEDFSGPGGQDRREEWIFRDNGEYGDWVPDAVAQILAARRERGSSLDVLGIRNQRVEELLKVAGYTRRKHVGDPDDQAPPVPETPVTKEGDLIVLGNHRLLCGDSTYAGDISNALGDHGPAQLVYTDPPYGVEYTGGMKKREALAGDEKGTNIYADFIAAMAEAEAVDGHAAMYLWHADRELPAVLAGLGDWEIRAGLVWRKNNAQYMTAAHYKHAHEPLLYLARGPVRWRGPNNETTIWDCDRSPRNDYHPTQKPVELAERAIRNSTAEGDTVLDLFGGSGSTLIGCETQNRRCVMIELDPGYCDVIVARWEALTGTAAQRP